MFIEQNDNLNTQSIHGVNKKIYNLHTYTMMICILLILVIFIESKIEYKRRQIMGSINWSESSRRFDSIYI